MDNRNVVTKSNHLIEASYKLTLNEQRLILAAIAKIDSRKDIPSNVRIEAQEFAQTFDLPANKAYEYLAEAADKLYDRDIQTFDGRVNTRFRWLSARTYVEGEGYVNLSFTADISQYLTNLKKEFTSYKIKLVTNLKSPYSIRLFEMLIRWKDTGKFVIGLDEFKSRLELDSKYTRFTNLKSRVLDPAIKDLQTNSGIIVSYRPIKEGREIVRIEFMFLVTEQLKLDIS